MGIPGAKGWTRPLPRNSPPSNGTSANERITAVCDEEILAQARAQEHKVAFFAIDGTIATGTFAPQAIRAIVEAIFGVDKGSIRVSLEKASLSLAFDPRRVAFAAIQRILDRKLARMRLSLLPMKVLE